jgi:hypothetical protein
MFARPCLSPAGLLGFLALTSLLLGDDIDFRPYQID